MAKGFKVKQKILISNNIYNCDFMDALSELMRSKIYIIIIFLLLPGCGYLNVNVTPSGPINDYIESHNSGLYVSPMGKFMRCSFLKSKDIDQEFFIGKTQSEIISLMEDNNYQCYFANHDLPLQCSSYFTVDCGYDYTWDSVFKFCFSFDHNKMYKHYLMNYISSTQNFSGNPNPVINERIRNMKILPCYSKHSGGTSPELEFYESK